MSWPADGGNHLNSVTEAGVRSPGEETLVTSGYIEFGLYSWQDNEIQVKASDAKTHIREARSGRRKQTTPGLPILERGYPAFPQESVRRQNKTT